GLSERRRDQIKKYSGGMKRRINIAAALLHDPKIVIMDEPTVGIDPQSRNHILDTVRRLNRERGLTVLYTSHYMEEVEQLCDRVYVMDHGKVIAEGTLPAVRALAGDEGAVWLQATAYPEGLLDALRALPGAGQAALAEDGVRLTRSSELALIDVLRAAEKAGVTVTNLSVSTTSLEDVFLHLTGRKLRD
ncbi:MAG: ABC transporter ATP-binding protein, partial [Trueperaceae bacterium]